MSEIIKTKKAKTQQHKTAPNRQIYALPDRRSQFAFINRRATQIKVMYWDRSGFCIWSKRLEEGRLISDWGAVQTREMDWTGLKLLLEGMEVKRVKKRYFRATSESQKTQ